jgi:hypothetical protein
MSSSEFTKWTILERVSPGSNSYLLNLIRHKQEKRTPEVDGAINKAAMNVILGMAKHE